MYFVSLLIIRYNKGIENKEEAMYSFMPSAVKLIGSSEEELLEKSVSEDHPFRLLSSSIKLDKIARKYRHLYSNLGAKGLPIEKAFRLLVIQFLEDYSDREMERAISENLAVKWLCGYQISEPTPDHSFFGIFRKRLGTQNLKNIFDEVNDKLRQAGLIGDAFSFVDATGIITKTALWDERDKAIANSEDKLNNANVSKYATDKDARYGCKGKDKFFYGYKRHCRVDMKQGMITKVAATPGNINDDKALKHICPKSGMVIADKGYDTEFAKAVAKKKGCHFKAIQKVNRKDKNKDFDHWLSKVRMPYESTFSKLHTRAKYRGIAKVQFQALAEAIAHNLKRLIKIIQTNQNAKTPFSTG
jgi:IS5 family transposase